MLKYQEERTQRMTFFFHKYNNKCHFQVVQLMKLSLVDLSESGFTW
jgi:hypothetical protein